MCKYRKANDNSYTKEVSTKSLKKINSQPSSINKFHYLLCSLIKNFALPKPAE